MTSLHDLIIEINNSDGIMFDKIEGYSCVGDIRSNSQLHPIQYIATSTVRGGDDDPFEGVGWTPTEAVRNLLKNIKKDNL
jgi:hypothetical protein